MDEQQRTHWEGCWRTPGHSECEPTSEEWRLAPLTAKLGIETDPEATYSTSFVRDLLRCITTLEAELAREKARTVKLLLKVSESTGIDFTPLLNMEPLDV